MAGKGKETKIFCSFDEWLVNLYFTRTKSVEIYKSSESREMSLLALSLRPPTANSASLSLAKLLAGSAHAMNEKHKDNNFIFSFKRSKKSF